jgi:hypothetical protein
MATLTWKTTIKAKPAKPSMGVYPSILFGACVGVVAQKSAILLALELKPKTFWCETTTNLCGNIKN